ncbi:hypothetical protein ACT7DI_01300 [Bacillus paranthracis]
MKFINQLLEDTKEKGLTSPVAVAAALDEEMKMIHKTRVQNILKRN